MIQSAVSARMDAFDLTINFRRVIHAIFVQFLKKLIPSHEKSIFGGILESILIKIMFRKVFLSIV